MRRSGLGRFVAPRSVDDVGATRRKNYSSLSIQTSLLFGNDVESTKQLVDLPYVRLTRIINELAIRELRSICSLVDHQSNGYDKQ